MDIDAVVTWVDGDDVAHTQLRTHYASIAKSDKHSPDNDSQLQHMTERYEESEELRYCLRSILRYGPWIRKIWVVTDDQFPAYFDRSLIPGEQIEFVNHKSIFRGYEESLPTFNSEAIETMIWRIPGLAERFLYFNDDVMMLQGVRQNDFYADNIVFSGRWADVSSKPPSTWLRTRLNAAQIYGFDRSKIFMQPHTIHPLLKSEFEELFNRHRRIMEDNLRFRFRNAKSIYPISLFYYHLLAAGIGKAVHPSGSVVVDDPSCLISPDQLGALEIRLKDRRSKMACFNRFGRMKEVNPDAIDMMDRVFGPKLQFEL